METLPKGEQRPSFKYEALDAVRNESLRPGYFKERLDAIKAGEPVWMVRTFKVSSGRERGYVHDFYQDKRWRGYIDGSPNDGFFVYREATAEEKEQDGPQAKLLNVTEPFETLRQAQASLEAYVCETSLD